MINIPWTEGWNYAYEMEKKPRGFGSCCRSDRRTEREWRRVEVWKKTMDWKLAKEEKRKCNAFSLLSIFIRAGSTRQPWFIWRRAWPAWPSHCSPYQRGLQGKSTRNAKYVTTLPSTYYYILVSYVMEEILKPPCTIILTNIVWSTIKYIMISEP